MSPTKKFSRQSLGEEIYSAIRRSILRGDMEPGQRLIEEKTAARFDASRTPVREAFLRLEREGLVERRAKGGFVVGGVEVREADEIMDMRAVLEGHAAARAAQRASADLIDRLEEMLLRYETAMKAGEVDRLVELNTQFHDLLYSASGSQRLKMMLEELRDYFYRFRRSILGMEGMDEQSHHDHVAMVDALAKGDSELAEKLVREHINRARSAMKIEAAKGRL